MIRMLLMAALLAVLPPVAQAQVSPDRVAEIAKTIHDREGWKLGGASSRETRNEFWARVIGVVHFGHPVYNTTPDPSWCLKDGGGGRPQSDDVAAKCATREFWDCIGGVGADGYEDDFRCNGHGGDRLPAVQNIYPPPRPRDSVPMPTPPAPGPALWTAAHGSVFGRMGAPRGSLDGDYVQRLAEQFAHSFPGEGWGRKSASAGRPLSGDVLARQVGGRLVGYVVAPATTAPAEIDITGQVFSAVAGVNHLGDTPAPEPVPEPTPTPEPTPPTEPTPQPLDLAPLLAAIAAQGEAIAALQAEVAAVRAQLAAGFDINATSRYFGGITGTVKPKE